MNKYSVWYMPYNKKYLITHPWQWFKCAWRNIRDAWHRSVYGWCYGDVWDWDSWFMNVVPDMLRHMANHGSAYPGHEPFETPEKWHDWLQKMANLIETANEQWQDEHNEYYEDYINNIMAQPWLEKKVDEKGNTCIEVPRNQFNDKYYERRAELQKQGQENIEYVMKNLGKYFMDLWD